MPLCAVRKPCPVAISMCNHPSSSKPQILPKRFNLFSPTGTETFELVLETICLAGQERSCTILDCFTRLSEERVAFFGLVGTQNVWLILCLSICNQYIPIPLVLPGLTNVSEQLGREGGK